MRNTVNDTQVGFVQGTTVLMADGRVKPIEKIVPGDWVMSFDQTDAASELAPMEVIDSINYISRDIIEVKADDRAVMVARGQLFLTPSADWHYATDTAFITDAEGNAKSFTVDRVQDGKHRVYDIMVDQHHSLVANGFRVHNITGVSAGARTQGNTATGKNSTKGQRSPSDDRQPTGQGTSKSPPSNKNTNDNNKPDTKKTSDPGNKQSVNNKDNGGRGKGGDGPGSPGRDNGQNQVNRKSSRNTKSDTNDRPKSPPPPAPEAMSYAALQALQDTMDYICDVMVNYTSSNYFTIRTAAIEYMNYADGLSIDSLVRARASSKISAADKETMRAYNEEILQLHIYIRTAFDPVKEPPGGPVTLVTRGCVQVKGLIDRSKSVLAKYVGTGRSTIDYTLPSMPKPPLVKPPIVPTDPVYVKTAPGQYVTTQNSPQGTGLTGGLGATYYRYRVVRGYLYGYGTNTGWQKIGPADQWEGQY